MLPIGIIRNLPASEYYKRELGVASKSGLDEFRRSPEHYRAWCEGIEPEPTPALVFGSAFHCDVLEPARFVTDYAIEPECWDSRTKDGKAARAAFEARHLGKTILRSEDGERLHAMAARARENEVIRECLSDPDGCAELTLSWADKATGIRCKARVDWYSPLYGIALDLKTTENASPSEFRRSVANYGYHRQNALYDDGFRANGIELDRFVFAAVEKSLPFGVACYWLSPDDVQKGRNANARDMESLAECVRCNEWPGYAGGKLELPSWAA